MVLQVHEKSDGAHVRRRVRAAAPLRAGYGQLRHPFAPQAAFSEDEIAAMHDTALRVLENLGPRMEYAGSVPRTQIPEILRNSRGLVFPSQWAESAVPLSYVEALVAARPVIAWHANGAADDVLSGGTGVVIQSWAELSGAIGTISDGWDYYSRQARQHFEANYSEARWVSRVTSIYESIAAGNPSQQA